MENLDQTQQEAPKRPVFLTVLCILTLIVTGFGVIGGLTGLFSGPPSPEAIAELQSSSEQSAQMLEDMGSVYWAGEIRKVNQIVEYTQTKFHTSTFISLLTALVGLVSALLMLRGRKNGFHLYIIYNLLNLVGVYAYVPIREVPVFMLITNTLISALFIFLYSRNLRYMNK